MKEHVRKLIESNLLILDDDVEFTDDDNLFEMGFVNSLFAMKLLNFIESEYSITIKNEDIDVNNFNSVNNIIRLIKKYKDN